MSVNPDDNGKPKVSIIAGIAPGLGASLCKTLVEKKLYFSGPCAFRKDEVFFGKRACYILYAYKM